MFPSRRASVTMKALSEEATRGARIPSRRVLRRPVTQGGKLPTRASSKMEDVARAAGVSPATVSRVFNSPDLVSPATRKAVLSAARRLRYVRDLTAGSLAARRTRIVAAVVPVITSPIFSESIEGLGEVLSQHGYQLLLGQTGYRSGEEAALVDTFLGRKVDGLVLTGRVQAGSLRSRLQRSGVPLVETWDIQGPALDLMVGFSNGDAAAAAARHLIERGYRSLAFVGGSDERSEMRLAGFRSTIAAVGLPMPAVVRFSSPAPSSLDAGAEALGRLLAGGDSPQGIFCSNDMIGAGVIFEAQRRGLAVPGRVAVMGFSDLPIARAVVPALSTVQVRAREIGAAAARLLLARIQGVSIAEPRLDLGFSLIRREST